jgi:nicotinate-nucleotide--dimethylbenzimidazole phosphoribosyltransferase
MSPSERDAAMGLGREAVLRAVADNVDVLALGEMGIGNTTAAAALAARLLGRPGVDLAGPGTGLDAAGVSHKARVIQRGLDREGPQDPLGALADLGGLEIAALVGAILEAAARRVPVVLDGFIVSVAALVAVQLNPNVRAHLIPATRSAEPGHGVVLDALDLGPPLLDWGLRLGEGSAATLALPLCRAACAALRDMATLDEVLGGR